MANLQPDVLLVAGTVPFRKAVIETESSHDLTEGIICGQVSGVDLNYENASITSHDLAHLFTETMENAS